MDLERRLREEPLKVRDVWSADKTVALSAGVLHLRRRRSLTRAGLALGTGLCATLIGLAWLRDGSGPVPVERARNTPALAPSAPVLPPPQAQVLRDGSRAEPLDRESSFTVSRDRPEHVTVVLQRGGVRIGSYRTRSVAWRSSTARAVRVHARRLGNANRWRARA